MHSTLTHRVQYRTPAGFIFGTSEEGLSIHEHTLDLAVFQSADPSHPSLCQEDLTSWVLGMHATVAEVVAGLQTVRVVGSGGAQYGVQDISGASIVIEFVKGELRIHNNSVGSDNSGVSIAAMPSRDPDFNFLLARFFVFCICFVYDTRSFRDVQFPLPIVCCSLPTRQQLEIHSISRVSAARACTLTVSLGDADRCHDKRPHVGLAPPERQ